MNSDRTLREKAEEVAELYFGGCSERRIRGFLVDDGFDHIEIDFLVSEGHEIWRIKCGLVDDIPEEKSEAEQPVFPGFETYDHTWNE